MQRSGLGHLSLGVLWGRRRLIAAPDSSLKTLQNLEPPVRAVDQVELDIL